MWNYKNTKKVDIYWQWRKDWHLNSQYVLILCEVLKDKIHICYLAKLPLEFIQTLLVDDKTERGRTWLDLLNSDLNWSGHLTNWEPHPNWNNLICTQTHALLFSDLASPANTCHCESHRFFHHLGKASTWPGTFLPCVSPPTDGAGYWSTLDATSHPLPP